MSEPASTKLCPTCGTRVSETATRCLVCGADLGSAEKGARPEQSLRGSRMPEITLSLPAVVFILVLFLAIGAVLAYVGLRRKPEAIGIQPVGTVIPPTATATITRTPTLTFTPAPPTSTFTPEPSPTPIEYTVGEGDTCIGIAAFFKVSMQSIVSMNNLGTTGCANLNAGRVLMIPQPTPTATGLPTATPGSAEQTRQACEVVPYVVQENDTLSSIALTYNVSMEAIRNWNGLAGNNVMLGITIDVPLCLRNATPGPPPPPPPPPPHPAPPHPPPPQGGGFDAADNTITLQWASVGTLRENEGYMVKVEDLTDTKNQLPAVYVTDTKYIIPVSFRPKESRAHVFSWTVVVVRQSGSADENGNPLWDVAGTISEPRLFSWTGAGAAAPTATPQP